MKAELIKPARGPNPAYSAKDHRAAIDAGEEYPHSPYIELPIGYQVEGKQVWGLCCPGHMNSAPVAKPIDDACKSAVKRWMEEKRPERIQAIANQLRESNYRRFKASHRKQLQELAAAYGLEAPDDPQVTGITTPEPNAGKGKKKETEPTT